MKILMLSIISVVAVMALQAEASLKKDITYFELEGTTPKEVLEQDRDQRTLHKYKKISVARALHLKNNSNIWVWVEPNCQSRVANFDEESSCEPHMLHYSEYLRALNSDSL